MRFIIERTYKPDRTKGTMLAPSGTKFRTLELPWLDNRHSISCIPEGTYSCKRYTRKTGQVCWELQGVADRTDILVHIANTVKDLMGCIGIGMAVGTVSGLVGIVMSTVAFRKFMRMTAGEESITIEIRKADAAG